MLNQTFAQPITLGNNPVASAFGWVASRCLQSHPWRQQCVTCINSCPANALTFQESNIHTDVIYTESTSQWLDKGLRLLASDACHGCAQCVAACPTEALLSGEHQQLTHKLQQPAQQTDAPVSIGCHRSQHSHPLDLQVHCLKSLSDDLLAHWRNLQPNRTMQFLVPDACSVCPASNEQACSQLLPQIQCESTPFRPAASARLNRRQLLTGLRSAIRPIYDAADNQPAPRRMQRHFLALKTGAAKLPQLQLDAARCDAQGLCVRLCPSKALTNNEHQSLIFNTMQCLGCNQCVDHCPEQALTLSQVEYDSECHLTTLLREGDEVRCFECGRTYPRSTTNPNTSDNTPSICPACRKDRALIEGGFASLFG